MLEGNVHWLPSLVPPDQWISGFSRHTGKSEKLIEFSFDLGILGCRWGRLYFEKKMHMIKNWPQIFWMTKCPTFIKCPTNQISLFLQFLSKQI
jgi:hypothetical protein